MRAPSSDRMFPRSGRRPRSVADSRHAAVQRRLGLATLAVGLMALTAISWLDWPDRRHVADPAVAVQAQQFHAETPKTTSLAKNRWAGNVGSHQCSECHADIAAHYQRSGMSQTWRELSKTVVLPLEWSGEVADERSGYRYRLLRQDHDYIQQERQIDEHSSHALERTARYQIGSGKHAAAFAAEHNGYLSQLPIGWFADANAWDLNPGYELRNQRFDRPITAGCVACHGGQPEHQSPASNRYSQPIAHGIGCQRCHGPGEAHVKHHRDGVDNAGGTTMVHPRKLDAERGNDVCLQCHLQGDVTLYRDGADAFSFRPGDRLRDHRVDYLARTDHQPVLSVASHGAALLASRCYQQSERLTCFDCHDPHRPVTDFTAQWFDDRCLKCHTDQSCSRTPVAAPRATSSCITCHMPKRATREGPHLATTDHRIRISRPGDGNKSANPVLPANAKVELREAAAGPNENQELAGPAYVLLHETMGPQLPSLDRGIELLQARLRQSPVDRQARYWLASALIARYRGGEAIRLLDSLVEAAPKWHEARFRLAVAHDQIKQYDLAIEHYERLVRDVPHWLEPYPLVARLYLFRGRAGDAQRLLEQQLSYQPDDQAWANLALARHLQQASREECLELIDRALKLNPRSTAAVLHRGYFHLAAGDKMAAERDFQQVLHWDKANSKAAAGLTAARQE